jgi:uncharacterized membrane protein
MTPPRIKALLQWLRARLPPHVAFASFGLLSMLTLLILTPPFMLPDEPQHFKRSFGLSSLEIWPQTRGGVTGIQAPKSVGELIVHYFEPRATTALPLADTVRELGRPLDPSRSEFLQMRADSMYAPPAYIPQSAAIAAGRAAGVGPLGLLYLARLANLLAAVVLITYALRILPVGRETGLLVALLPMTQAMLVSAGPDAVTIAGAFVFTALLTRAFEDGYWSAERLAAMAGAGLLMCSTKVVYLPLLGAGLAILAARNVAGVRRVWVAGVQVVVALAIAALGAYWLSTTTTSEARAGTDAARQVSVVLADPLRFLAVAARSVVHDAGWLVRSALGVLGWTNLFLPGWVYLMLALAFPISLAASRDKPGALPLVSVAWFVALMLATLLLIEFGLYLVWTPVGRSLVEGVQGRYFLPMAPLAAYMAASLWAPLRRFADSDLCYAALLGVIGVASLMTFAATAGFFGLFRG